MHFEVITFKELLGKSLIYQVISAAIDGKKKM